MAETWQFNPVVVETFHSKPQMSTSSYFSQRGATHTSMAKKFSFGSQTYSFTSNHDCQLTQYRGDLTLPASENMKKTQQCL